jgi:hypothetical protein
LIDPRLLSVTIALTMKSSLPHMPRGDEEVEAEFSAIDIYAPFASRALGHRVKITSVSADTIQADRILL